MAKTITITITEPEDDYDDIHDELMLEDFLQTPNNFRVQLVPEVPILGKSPPSPNIRLPSYYCLNPKCSWAEVNTLQERCPECHAPLESLPTDDEHESPDTNLPKETK